MKKCNRIRFEWRPTAKNRTSYMKVCAHADCPNYSSCKYNRNLKYVVAFAAVFTFTSCATAPKVYRVTFSNGDVDYYELNYRPKAGATSIEYDGTTIMGVEKIEKY